MNEAENMKVGSKFYLGAATAIILVVSAYFILNKKNPEPVKPKKHPYDFSGPCPGETKNQKMTDVYMRGVLEQNQVYKLATNWYWCNPVEREDLVLLKFSQSLDPVVRSVYGIPRDKFKVVFNKKQSAWNVEINGDLVEFNGQPYYFGSGDPKLPPPLKLLEGSRKGLLLDREIIVFSSFPPGDRDSGTLGVVNLNDALGKVILIEDSSAETK